MVLPKEEWKQYEQAINKDIGMYGELMMKEVGDRVTKASFLKDYEVFEKKYPFLCVNDQSSEKALVQSICRYPSEIKEGLVYIGNMINVLDKNSG